MVCFSQKDRRVGGAEDEYWMNCIITTDVMVDPVLTIYGHYYERQALLEWIRRDQTCPQTRQPLTENDILAPDPAFIERLNKWKADNPDLL